MSPELSGGGISTTYLPVGAGGLAHLQCQDAQRTLNFTGDQIRIGECDRRIELHLRTMDTKAGEPPLEPATPRRSKKSSGFDLRDQLCRIAGVDLTRLDGVDVWTAQTVISEVGVDMSRWKTEKQFASWLGLCPDNRISGGKVLKRGTRHVVNRAATALRLSAWSLMRSQSALGANFRRL